MKLDKLYELRTKKRISRKNLAIKLNEFQEFANLKTRYTFTDIFIKQIETQEVDGLNPKILEIICQYFGMTLKELTGKDYKDLEQDYNRKTIVTEKIEIPKDVDKEDIDSLFKQMVKKYPILDENNIDTFIAEFKYRVGDLKPHRRDIWKTFIKQMEDEQNIIPHDPRDEDKITEVSKVYEDNFDNITNDVTYETDVDNNTYLKYKYPLDPPKDSEISIRQTGTTAAIIYKELRAQGLSFNEAISIIRAILG